MGTLQAIWKGNSNTTIFPLLMVLDLICQLQSVWKALFMEALLSSCLGKTFFSCSILEHVLLRAGDFHSVPSVQYLIQASTSSVMGCSAGSSVHCASRHGPRMPCISEIISILILNRVLHENCSGNELLIINKSAISEHRIKELLLTDTSKISIEGNTTC